MVRGLFIASGAQAGPPMAVEPLVISRSPFPWDWLRVNLSRPSRALARRLCEPKSTTFVILAKAGRWDSHLPGYRPHPLSERRPRRLLVGDRIQQLAAGLRLDAGNAYDVEFADPHLRGKE